MKKKFILVLVVLMTLAMVLPASAATPAPGGPFSTAFRIQNLEASSAVTCDYTFYNAQGGVAFTSGQSGAINAGDSLFVYVRMSPACPPALPAQWAAPVKLRCGQLRC
jgi:hypothetical protein